MSKPIKTYYNKNRTKVCWFDRWCKVWTMQHIDAEGNQLGSAEHCHSRSFAFEWLAS